MWPKLSFSWSWTNLCECVFNYLYDMFVIMHILAIIVKYHHYYHLSILWLWMTMMIIVICSYFVLASQPRLLVSLSPNTIQLLLVRNSCENDRNFSSEMLMASSHVQLIDFWGWVTLYIYICMSVMYVCISMYVCMYVCMHACMHACMHVRRCVRM